MSEQEKWEEEATDYFIIFANNDLPKYHNLLDYNFGYLQACKVRQEEIDKKEIERGEFSKELIEERMKVVELKDLISEAGPLAWMMNDDTIGASEWEKKAFKLIGGKVK